MIYKLQNEIKNRNKKRMINHDSANLDYITI